MHAPLIRNPGSAGGNGTKIKGIGIFGFRSGQQSLESDTMGSVMAKERSPDCDFLRRFPAWLCLEPDRREKEEERHEVARLHGWELVYGWAARA